MILRDNHSAAIDERNHHGRGTQPLTPPNRNDGFPTTWGSGDLRSVVQEEFCPNGRLLLSKLSRACSARRGVYGLLTPQLLYMALSNIEPGLLIIGLFLVRGMFSASSAAHTGFWVT